MLTFGTFLNELAFSNEREAFILSTSVTESPDAWRNSGRAIVENAADGTYTLFDLRPLRALAHAGEIEEMPDWLDRGIHRADAALVIRGGRTGGYETARRNLGENAR